MPTPDPRKPKYVLSLMLGSLFAVMFSTWLSAWYLGERADLVISMSLTLLGAAVLSHFHAKKYGRVLYYLAIFLNSAAIGVAISLYYVFTETELSIFDAGAGAMMAFCAYIFLSMVSLLLPERPKTGLILQTVLFLVAVALYIALWINGEPEFFSMGFFCLIPFLPYAIALCVLKKLSILRRFSLGSFGAFALVALVVMTILSDGDVLELGASAAEVAAENKKEKK